MRRFAVHNRLSRLVTLTYRGDGCHDFDRMRSDVAQFERRLRAAYPAMGSVWTWELHPGGHGWHVHGGVGAFVPQRQLARLWGHGFVDVRKVRPGRPGQGREAARRVAVYLSKYIGKDAEGTPPGRQRYAVRQGFQPVARVVALGDVADPERAMLQELGGEVPSYAWWSWGDPVWVGPPAGYLAFG